MASKLGCIADDFTGATDIAGLLARSGRRVTLHLGVPDATVDDPAEIDVIALKCRTEPVAAAVAECRAAYQWLKSAGAKRFYWKYCSTFDSTPEGNIGPVAEMLMQETGAGQTIYCPAFPENGRSVYMGVLFVGQQPLAESPMKDHPLTPMRDSNLMRLLAPQVSRPVGLADRPVVTRGVSALRQHLGQLDAEGCGHVVVDAVSDDDLAIIAESVADWPLVTGGSALARYLPGIYGHAGGGSTRPPAPVLPAGAVVLSGSCSAATRAQVAAFADQHPRFALDPIKLAEEGVAEAEAWLRQQDPSSAPMITATAEPETVQRAQQALGVEAAGKLVEDALAALAMAAFEHGIRRFVVAGGETAGAVARGLGVARLEIGDEIAPGVPWTYSTCQGEDIAITLKSGNFGGVRFFDDALRALDGAA